MMLVKLLRQIDNNVQSKMKLWYNKVARDSHFEHGGRVLVFVRLFWHHLQARNYSPY
jgi:hypothetical protein